ncbi:MAG: phage holin family protein [Pseudonocardiaceae bacterium]
MTEQMGRRHAAGVLAWYGGATLIAAFVLVLALVLPAWVSALIVGVAVLATAGLLGLVAGKQVRSATPPIPEQATESVKDDVAAVRGRMHS